MNPIQPNWPKLNQPRFQICFIKRAHQRPCLEELWLLRTYFMVITKRVSILYTIGVHICKLQLYKKSSLQDFIGRIGKNLFYGLSAKGSSITNETHRRTQFKLRSSPYPKGQYIGRLWRPYLRITFIKIAPCRTYVKWL